MKGRIIPVLLMIWYAMMLENHWLAVSHNGWGQPRVWQDTVLVKSGFGNADSLFAIAGGDTAIMLLSDAEAYHLAQSWDSPPLIQVPEPDSLETQ